MEHAPVDLFLTPKDIADLLGMTVQGVHKILKDQGIDSKVPNGRQHRIYPADFRRLIKNKNLPIPSHVIAIHLVKGGVGKTTMVHALASRASALGLRTLVLDLDQQANLSTSFGIYSRPKHDPTILDVHMGQMGSKKVRIQDAIVKVTDFLHVIPSNLSLANLDVAIIQGTENLGRLFSDMFKPVRNDYDLIFIDCPPSLSRVTSAAHCFASKILMPVNMDRFSLDGLDLTLDHVALLKKKFSAKAEVHVVINKFDARQKLGFEIINQLTSEHKDILCETYISTSKQIDNSVAGGECLWNPSSGKNSALEDFHNLLVEIFALDRWKNRSVAANNVTTKSGMRSRREASANV